MTRAVNIGVLGIGVHLPEEVRKNDWWPEALVRKWRESLDRKWGSPDGGPPPDMTEGMKLVLEAMAEYRSDPFQGTVERRVAPEGSRSSDLEIAAGEAAIENARADRREIDLLLSQSSTPDYLTTPNACLLHRELGLARNCFTLSTEAACNSFLLQLEIARSMIASGRARTALLVQSNGVDLLPNDQPYSSWFGAAATAVLVGRVADQRGVLATAHRTDGTLHDAVVSTVPGKRWFEDGRIVWHPKVKGAAQKMFSVIADRAREVITSALADSGIAPDQVDYYASHQATPWLQRVTQTHAGLTNARRVDSFGWTGSLSACNVPLLLALGEKEGLLREGDVAVLFAGGSGETWSSVVMRWGR